MIKADSTGALIAPLGVTTRERVRRIEGQALRAKLDQLVQWGE